MKKSKGFTLIEMLVVVALFGIIAVVGSGIFLSTLRGSSKTNVTNLVKQEGSFALSLMERMIRNSRGIVGSCDLAMNEITIINPDEEETTFVCIGSGSSEISSNSASLISNLVSVESCSIDCTSGGEINPNVVEISFVLTQALESEEKQNIAEVGFNKKITLRNVD